MKNIVLLSCVFLIFSCTEKKNLIIVTNDNHKEIKVTEDDPRISDIWDDGETFIDNKSDKSIYLEGVEYSTSFKILTSAPTTHEIPPNTMYSTEKTIDYIFTSPPSSVRIRGNSVTKWHLHR